MKILRVALLVTILLMLGAGNAYAAPSVYLTVEKAVQATGSPSHLITTTSDVTSLSCRFDLDDWGECVLPM